MECYRKCGWEEQLYAAWKDVALKLGFRNDALFAFVLNIDK